MKRVHVVLGLMLTLLANLCSQAQTIATATNAIVPPLVSFSGILNDDNGRPLSGTVGVTFYLYKEQQGGSPLWLETQNVQPDKTGHYSVMLGSTTSEGLPASIFASGEAHWLGVQVQGEEARPRVLLVSAPYALKAADAETIGGLPPSAFMLAASTSANAPSSNGTAQPGASGGPFIFGSGTAGFVPLWTSSSILGDSALFQSGSGNSATVGINTATPAATLDVNGGVIARGTMQLPSTGTANASRGFNSQPFLLQGSSFNSGTGNAVGPLFQWQTEPSGNNTSNPAGTLNLLYGTGSGSPTETGLNIASNGQITFATGQKFPGTGAGTVTSVGSGAGLTGGPISSSGTLSIATGGVSNAMLANSSVTITAGTDLSGGGTVALGSSTTLSLNTGATDLRYAQLGANNTLTGVQTITNQENITANSSTEALDVNQSGGSGSGIVANTNSSTGYGISGNVTATAGSYAGVYGSTASPNGIGVEGISNSTSSSSIGGTGVYGFTSNPTGNGVEGVSANVGVYGSGGSISSTTGTGVMGCGHAIGVYATNNGMNSEGQFGVYGIVGNTGAFNLGVTGINNGVGYAVYGESFGTSGIGGAFVGGASGPGASALGGDANSTGPGGSGGAFTGGNSPSGVGGSGVVGLAGNGPVTTTTVVAGVEGNSNGTGPGTFGGDGASLSGTGNGWVGYGLGVWGDNSVTSAVGVLGTADNGIRVTAVNNSGSLPSLNVFNGSTSETAQVFYAGSENTGGFAIIGGSGCGSSFLGLQLGQDGMSACNNYTLLGDTNGGTYINANSTSQGIVLRINNGGSSHTNALAVNTDSSVTTGGNLTVTGALKVLGNKNFIIDHPLDPANKYLYHAAIESSEVLNLYTGNVVLNGSGEAVIQLPDWFEVINKDFRYQLTPVGAPGRDLYIAEEVSGGHFKIAGGAPGGKVSWQLAGVRNDAWEKAHPLVVEEDKGVNRGHYLAPELYGAPATARIGYVQMMPDAPPSGHPKFARNLPQGSGSPAIRPMIRPRRIALPRPPVVTQSLQAKQQATK